MRVVDAIRLAAGGLSERKTRTALTLLGILIGTSMIVALTSSTEGQGRSISAQLEKLGPTTILVRSTDSDVSFTTTDVQRVQRMGGASRVLLTVSGTGDVTRTGDDLEVNVLGIEPADLQQLVKGIEVADGAMYPAGDSQRVLLGAKVAFPSTESRPVAGAGDLVQVLVQVRQAGAESEASRRAYVVAGVAKSFGSSPFVDVDNTVFMSPRAAQQLLRVAHSNQMVVIATGTDTVDDLTAKLQEEYKDEAMVLSGTQISRAVDSVFGAIRAILATIAGISLVVAGVGIANTMLVSVLERVTEIGVLKALGFKAREVLAIFLLEAGLTGLVGGILGCGLGAILAYGISRLMAIGTAAQQQQEPEGFDGSSSAGPGIGEFSIDTSPVFSLELFLLVILFAVAVSMLAGYIPARKAARMAPVQALKRV